MSSEARLKEDLEACREDLFAHAGTITNRDKATIEARVKHLLKLKGWLFLDSVKADLDDPMESVLVSVRHGRANADLFLKWERADGSVAVRVDTDGDGL